MAQIALQFIHQCGKLLSVRNPRQGEFAAGVNALRTFPDACICVGTKIAGLETGRP